MKRIYEKLVSLDDQDFIFWVSLIFYAVLFFSPNNKILALSFALFIGILFIRFKNLTIAFFWGFISSLPIIVGKTYIINLIPATQLFRLDNPEGYFIKLVITPGIIIALFLLPSLFKNLIMLARRKELKLDLINFWVLVLILSVLISTLGSKNLAISSFFYLQFLELPLLFFFSRYLINWHEKTKDMLMMLLFSQAIFISLLVFLQYLHGGPLGLSLEAMTRIVPFGAGTDEDVWRFRPTATFNHANFVAAYLVPILIINFSLFYKSNRKTNGLLIFPFLLAGLALVMTLSRSAWASLALGIILLTYFFEKKRHLMIEEIYRQRFLLLAILVLVSLPVFVGPRIIDSFNTFVSGGSLFTRMELIQESLGVINEHPFFGVGLNMSVLEMFENNPRGMMYFFPAPVHNWYLNFASDVGIPALLIFIFLLNFSLKRVLTGIKKDTFSLVAAIAIIAMLINGLFQPFFGNEALLFVFLGILNSKNG